MARHVPRVYSVALGSDEFELAGACAHHLVSVLKIRQGGEFIAFNEIDGEWMCSIESITKAGVVAKKHTLLRTLEGPVKRLATAACVVKPDTMRTIVEKCTELGATDIFLLLSVYTNVHTISMEKLSAIAVGASEQSERLDIPRIHRPQKLVEFIEELPGGFMWISAVERISGRSNVTSIIEADLRGDCGFIVGPEGGFSEAEKALLLARTTAVTLSNNVLRSETAAIACLAICSAKNAALTRTSR
ncbi:MAG: 16S rRNA (uracil(1498)-N(3))-methyltransferase [Holosporales bacterium]|nr:16S rRNA (uracil(1498)-N(3))-methyltransferase [Holosporales bacterium]